MIAFAGLICAAPLHPIAPLQRGPMPLLGDISYSLYLTHEMMGYWVIAWLEDRQVGPNAVIAIAGRTLRRCRIDLALHLLAEAQRKREVIDGTKGQALLDAVFEAVGAYPRQHSDCYRSSD
jgi:hypothetical protein